MGTLRLLILVSLTIFAGEIGIMLVLDRYPVEDEILRAAIDATALTVIVFPFLYFLFFKTLLRTARSLATAREHLLQHQESLEKQIDQRTNEIRIANEALEGTVQQLRERHEEMIQLAELMSYFQSCRNLNEGLDIAKSWLQEAFSKMSGALFLINASRNMLEPAFTWGQAAEMKQCYSPDDCWSLRRGKPHESCGSDHAIVCRHLELNKEHWHICLPLTGQGQALGTLCLQAECSPNAKSEGAGGNDFYVEVAERLALAITNLRLRETLSFQALRDPLTGLFNRRYLFDTLDRELERAASREQEVSIVMLDIDHFKKFNDAFGHAAADVVLGRLGSLLHEWERGEDIVARYGGEEFMIVLPDTPPAIALERIDSLRRAIEELTIEQHGQLLARVTISAGIAAYPLHGTNGAVLTNLADQALYSAKKGGRNRVTVASQTAGLTHTLAGAAQSETSSAPSSISARTA